MLLMDTLEPLLRGEKMAPDQVKTLYRLVQSTKAAKAQELLDASVCTRSKENVDRITRVGNPFFAVLAVNLIVAGAHGTLGFDSLTPSDGFLIQTTISASATSAATRGQ
jgi:hypothetical protein